MLGSTSEGWSVRVHTLSVNPLKGESESKRADGVKKKRHYGVEHKTGQEENTAVMDHRWRKWSCNAARYAHYRASGSVYWLKNASVFGLGHTTQISELSDRRAVHTTQLPVMYSWILKSSRLVTLDGWSETESNVTRSFTGRNSRWVRLVSELCSDAHEKVGHKSFEHWFLAKETKIKERVWAREMILYSLEKS